MQSYNERERLIQSVPVDLSNPDELAARVKAAEKKGATHHVIGKLPKSGMTVTLDGLKYRVQFAEHVRGVFTVKMTLMKERKVNPNAKPRVKE